MGKRNRSTKKYISKKKRNIPDDSEDKVEKCNDRTVATTQLESRQLRLKFDSQPKGKVVFYKVNESLTKRKYIPHPCGPHCLYPARYNLGGYGPLAKPLVSGWKREIVESKGKVDIIYVTPCGRLVRSMEENHQYLMNTKSILNDDNFDFDVNINCLTEYVIESPYVGKNDLSNGLEKMKIPCINYYDKTMAPEFQYSRGRTLTKDVNLNLDPNFLVGCECEDDCSDKTKCSCWQLTLAGAKFGNPNTPLENVGYVYKRLLEPVRTGIYECNKNCKCSANCLNRVVQQPFQMKLQVFKTSNRGWGVRCLNDIPKGSFVCIYGGLLLTEQKANEVGKKLGDEYHAGLDYIEVVEKIKYGYESDIPEEEDSDEEYKPPKELASRKKSKVIASRDKQLRITTRLRSMKMIEETDINSNYYLKENYEASTNDRKVTKFRNYHGPNESCYIMDAKKVGNIGRYFNHSCAPNLFVQNVFIDSHDLRFPWVGFFTSSIIRCGSELTWDYNYEVGSVHGKSLYCKCGTPNCRKRLL